MSASALTVPAGLRDGFLTEASASNVFVVKAGVVVGDLLVRPIANQFFEGIERRIDGTEYFHRLFLEHVQSARRALVRNRADVAVADPRGESEKDHRQDQCGNDRQLKQAQGQVAVCS